MANWLGLWSGADSKKSASYEEVQTKTDAKFKPFCSELEKANEKLDEIERRKKVACEQIISGISRRALDKSHIDQ